MTTPGDRHLTSHLRKLRKPQLKICSLPILKKCTVCVRANSTIWIPEPQETTTVLSVEVAAVAVTAKALSAIMVPQDNNSSRCNIYPCTVIYVTGHFVQMVLYAAVTMFSVKVRSNEKVVGDHL